MLRQLTIHGLAVIDRLTLDFAGGFTVLTGETGAGKSILIDAVGLVLGDRTDAGLVRPGSELAEVTAEFDLDDTGDAAALLREQGLEDAEQPARCLLRRQIYTEGRSRGFINDRPVALTTLRALGERLLEIYGQGESRTLARGEVQRALLDRFGGHTEALAAVAEAAAELKCIDDQIQRLRQLGGRDPAQLEFLRFQLQELEALALADGELERLESEHRRLANAGRLIEEGAQAQHLLYGGEASTYDQLAAALGLLRGLSELHPEFGAAAELTAAAQAQVKEAAETLRHLLNRLDLDPERLEEVERRLAAIHELARKHRVRPAELADRQARLGAELAETAGAAEALAALEQQTTVAGERYRRAAAALSAARHKAAQPLAAAITARLKRLGLPNARFAVVVEPSPREQTAACGVDEVRFDFSANPGQPLRPLARAASGGELSRVALAIQVAVGGDTGGRTMIFDEVDAGIGGGVAEVVGAELRALAGGRQVLCVTHLPQVAAQGHHHFAIVKEVRGGQTFTRVALLDRAARVAELARMAGGREITRAATAHARALLDRAGN